MSKIETEHGVFTDNELTGQTAQEVYDEWLNSRDKPQPPTDKERLEAAEQAIIMLMMEG